MRGLNFFRNYRLCSQEIKLRLEKMSLMERFLPRAFLVFRACAPYLGLAPAVWYGGSGANRRLQTNASHLMPALSHLWSFSDTDQSWQGDRQIMPPLAAIMSPCMCSLFWQHLNINLIICQSAKLFGVTAHLRAPKSHNSLLLCKQATSHYRQSPLTSSHSSLDSYFETIHCDIVNSPSTRAFSLSTSPVVEIILGHEL